MGLKTVMKNKFEFILISLLFRTNQFLCHANNSTPKLLLISLDGFRWDYIHKTQNIPNFRRMITEGSWSEKGLKNTFLTKTFPNHLTLVTGLYEESHGIVGNSMYDPILNDTFSTYNMADIKDPRWMDNGAEPIWVTNQRQNTQHRSGTLFWPGNESSMKGFFSYRHLDYDYTMPMKQRIDIIINWLTDEFPVNLALLYNPEPDGIGHHFGPNSPEIVQKIEELDGDIGYLFKRLEEKGLLSNMNIILTSDHGMTDTPNDAEHKIDLNKYISIDSYFITTSSPVAMIRPKTTELIDEIYKNLSGIPHVHVYKKADIPAQYHFQHNRRIQEILVVPEEHYWVSYNNSNGVVGNHGYNNSIESMHPVFLAMGPSFKPGSTVQIFDNVDVYPLMCLLLQLEPAPNNGSLDIVKSLLVEANQGNVFGTYIFILLFGGLVTGIFSVAACQVQRRYRKHRLQLRSIKGIIPDSVHFSPTSDRAPLMSETSDEEIDLPNFKQGLIWLSKTGRSHFSLQPKQGEVLKNREK